MTPSDNSTANQPGTKRRIVLMVLTALLLLGAGGWLVLRPRLAAAKNTQLEAVARALLSEEKNRWGALTNELTEATRQLDDLKTQVSTTAEKPAGVKAERQALLSAYKTYVEWLRPYLDNHPVNAQFTQLEVLLAAKSGAEAAALATGLGQNLGNAETELAAQKKSLLTLTVQVHLTSEPAGQNYSYTDAYGRTVTGCTPFKGELPLGPLAVKITAPRGWVDYELKTEVKRGAPLVLHREFGQGNLTINSSPSGLPFKVKNAAGYAKSGTTPVDLRDVPSGEVHVRVTRPDWPDFDQSVSVSNAGSHRVVAEFEPGSVEVSSTPSGAEVWLDGKKVGVTPFTLTARPGPVSGELRIKRYRRSPFNGEVKAKDTTHLSLSLEKLPELEPELGDTMTIPGLKLTLRGVGPGSFMMGSKKQRTAHKVTITQGYWLGQTEVTQAQWIAIMNSNPSQNQNEALPLESASWNEIMAFCQKLTEREHAAKRLPEGWYYTLPTEAQWEYACRAGATGDIPDKLDSMAWYGETKSFKPHPVAQKQANAWGFFDMLGNVQEKCSDWAGSVQQTAATDPSGPDTGFHHVDRGGLWRSGAELSDYGAPSCTYVSCAFRLPNYKDISSGFRLALRYCPKPPNVTAAPTGSLSR